MQAPKTAPRAANKQASPPPAPAAAQPVAANLVTELKVSANLMALPAGLFCIVNEPSAKGQTAGLPGVRLSAPPGAAQNLEIISFRPDGWLGPQGDAALVRVHRGPAQVLVTIYETPNQLEGAPKLQVRQLIGVSDIAAAAAQAAGPGAPPPPVPMDIMAHIQTRGDVGVKFGTRLGEVGSQNWIEGFAIAAPEGISPADLSYQAVLGRGWLSPWVEAGEYCGSRGMALPLLGLRVRLTGEAAAAYDLTCEASFVDGSAAGPVGSDETCEGENLAPLESILLNLTPKSRKPAKPKR
jgi:hypothetical protein